MILIILIPIIGVIWLFVLFLTEGDSYENQYGENPKNINKENYNINETVKKDDDFNESLLLVSKKIKLLEETFKSGLITQKELNEKLRILENEKILIDSKLKENEFILEIEEQIKIDKEKLIELKKQGLLTDIEYENKIDFLFKKQVEINDNERLEMEKQLEKEKGRALTATTEYLLIGGAILIILLFVTFRYFTSDF
jgi:uncharacterized UPF0160 family protein